MWYNDIVPGVSVGHGGWGALEYLCSMVPPVMVQRTAIKQYHQFQLSIMKTTKKSGLAGTTATSMCPRICTPIGPRTASARIEHPRNIISGNERLDCTGTDLPQESAARCGK